MPKIRPALWYAKDAEAAARLYASIFPDSHVDRVTRLAADSPSGPPGSVVVVELTLFGQPFMAMTAGPHHDFNDAISFQILCDSQAEIDRYWDALLADGGTPQACGWLTDRFGVRWQIVPAVLHELIAGPHARPVHAEMMTQVKLDIARLEAAAR